MFRYINPVAPKMKEKVELMCTLSYGMMYTASWVRGGQNVTLENHFLRRLKTDVYKLIKKIVYRRNF